MYKVIYNFTSSHWNEVVAFIWGFSEATIFFIIPDVYITFVLLFSIRAGFTAIVWSIIGSIFGGICIYLLHMFSFNFLSVLLMIPGITLVMIKHAMKIFEGNNFPGFSSVPFSGIPYKIYAYSASYYEMPFYLFIVWTIVARIIRYAFPITVVIIIKKVFDEHIRKHVKFWLVAYCIIWISFYIWYLSTIDKIY